MPGRQIAIYLPGTNCLLFIAILKLNQNDYLNFAETGKEKQRLALVASFPWLLPCSLTPGETRRDHKPYDH